MSIGRGKTIDLSNTPEITVFAEHTVLIKINERIFGE
jgi:hypothetical protein